jgi:hypothetical protein
MTHQEEIARLSRKLAIQETVIQLYVRRQEELWEALQQALDLLEQTYRAWPVVRKR